MDGPDLNENIAFSPSGELFLSYEDASNSFKTTVKKYDSPDLSDKIQTSQLSIYPNPTNGIITIETTAKLAQSHLSIISLDGKELLTQDITKQLSIIDISTLSNGIYFARFTNNKKIEMRKIIKE
jgi:hypothetical protein